MTPLDPCPSDTGLVPSECSLWPFLHCIASCNSRRRRFTIVFRSFSLSPYLGVSLFISSPIFFATCLPFSQHAKEVKARREREERERQEALEAKIKEKEVGLGPVYALLSTPDVTLTHQSSLASFFNPTKKKITTGTPKQFSQLACAASGQQCPKRERWRIANLTPPRRSFSGKVGQFSLADRLSCHRSCAPWQSARNDSAVCALSCHQPHAQL